MKKLYIKNMVCPRCIKVVREEIENFGHEISEISLGEVEIKDKLSEEEISKISDVLVDEGFELLLDNKAKLIENIKTAVIELINNSDEIDLFDVNYSKYISDNLNKEYHYLSTLFSSVENITIEHYIILQKIEKAKELLKYNEMTLSEISYKLGYSSVQYLSSQFKKVTGLSATEFKKLTENKRKPIDNLS